MPSLARTKREIQRDPNDATRLAAFDVAINAPVGQTVAHAKNHEGRKFVFDHIADGDYSIAFKIPDSGIGVHMTLGLSCEDETLVQVYRGRTWDAGTGTVLPIYNRNHNSANQSVIEENKTANPDWTGNGVLLTPDNPTGGVIIPPRFKAWSPITQTVIFRDEDESIYKINETYVVHVDVIDAKGSHLLFSWYEHEAPQ